MQYETDIPTQQNTAQKNLRLPRTDENHLGPQGHQPAPQSRSQTPRRLKFPKADRLLKRHEFAKVTREGKRLVGRFLCIDYRPAKRRRLGISASGRFGSAPERNRFKRLVREAFRMNGGPLMEIHVIPRQGAKGAHFSDIQHEIATLFKPTATAGR